MKRETVDLPTARELDFLRVMWELDAGSVVAIWKELVRHGEKIAYHTALAHMQHMRQKGLLIREGSSNPSRYYSGFSQEETQRALVSDLLERAFNGSVSAFVERALIPDDVSLADLKEIRKLLKDRKPSKPGRSTSSRKPRP